MKSTMLKAIKTVALSLVLVLGASGLVFANGAGSSPAAHAGNGGGNGAGGTKSRKHRRVARRHGKAKSKTA